MLICEYCGKDYEKRLERCDHSYRPHCFRWKSADTISPAAHAAKAKGVNENCEAQDLAVVMSYEAMRICLGLPTRYHPPAEVIRWMQTMLKETNQQNESNGASA